MEPAAELFERVALDEFVEFLTLPAYEQQRLGLVRWVASGSTSSSSSRRSCLDWASSGG